MGTGSSPGIFNDIGETVKQNNKIKRLRTRLYAYENAVFAVGHGPVASSYNKPGSLKKS